MKTDYPASGNYVLPFSQAAVNCCQWKQFFLQLKHIFQPTLHSGLWKVFCLLETVFLYSKFFLLCNIVLLKFEGSQIWRTSHIPASGHQFFRFFQILFNVEAMLSYSGIVFFNILYPANANEFSAYGNSILQKLVEANCKRKSIF